MAKPRLIIVVRHAQSEGNSMPLPSSILFHPLY